MESDYRNISSKRIGRYGAGKVLPEKIDGFTRGDLFRIMEGGINPYYHKNDVLLCARMHRIRHLKSGDFIIAEIKDHFVLMRLVQIEDEHLLVCDNEAFQLFEVDKKEFSTIWKVMRKMTPAILNDEQYEGKGIPYLERELELIKGSLRVLEEKLRQRD